MAHNETIMVIRCEGCKKKLFKYYKKGKGSLLRMYKSRIWEDNSVHKGGYLYCQCGRRVGKDMGKYIKVYGDYRFD